MRPEKLYTTTLGSKLNIAEVDYVTPIKRIEETRSGGYFVYRAEYSIIYKDGRKSLVSLHLKTTKTKVVTSEHWWSVQEEPLKKDCKDLMKKVKDYGYLVIGLPESRKKYSIRVVS
jgi:hypothetical protein